MAPATAALDDRSGRLPLLARLLAIPATAILVLVGLWVVAGVIAPGGYDGSIAAAVIWFVVAYVALRLAFRRWPALRLPAQASFAACAIGVAFWFGWTTFRDTTVSEQIVVGVPASDGGTAGDGGGGAAVDVELARGAFESLAHGGSGTAAVVELAGSGRVLTFDDLDVDNGPDLRVYLVEGPTDGNGEGASFVDLGALKGNRGDQQYELPADVDLTRYTEVVVWCRAFSVGFARAALSPS